MDDERPGGSKKGLRRDSELQRISRSRFCPEQPVRPFLKAVAAVFSLRCCIVEPIVALNQLEVFCSWPLRSRCGFDVQRSRGANSGEPGNIASGIFAFRHVEFHDVPG
jgi:hypothetical protein